jgi:hypothetical protein
MGFDGDTATIIWCYRGSTSLNFSALRSAQVTEETGYHFNIYAGGDLLANFWVFSSAEDVAMEEICIYLTIN